jgi:hypothetical protein
VTGQTGLEVGDLAFYGGVSGFAEEGWRELSPSNLQQVYGDARWRGVGAESAFNLVYTNSNLIGNGSSPIQLLREDRSAIFTAPDQTKNELFGIATQNNFSLRPNVSLQANAYYRHLQRNTANGDDSDFDECAAPEGFLCAEQAPDHPITDTQDPIPSEVNGQAIGNGVFNTTGTTTDMVGGAAQAAIEEPLLALTNHFVLGSSVDAGFVKYNNKTQVGTLNPDRSVTGSGFFLGGNEFNTRLRFTNVYVGAYFSDTLSLTDELAATVAGRFNYEIIDLTDELGTELTGDHYYDRFDPAGWRDVPIDPQREPVRRLQRIESRADSGRAQLCRPGPSQCLRFRSSAAASDHSIVRGGSSGRTRPPRGPDVDPLVGRRLRIAQLRRHYLRSRGADARDGLLQERGDHAARGR